MALDDVLGYWGAPNWLGRRSDPVYVSDLLRNAFCFGMTGSGKSSGFALAVARMLLRYRNSGGLILSSKPEDKAWWVERFNEAGRPKDLIVMEPGGGVRWNVMEYERKRGVDARGLTKLLMVTKDTINRARGGKVEPFWDGQNEIDISTGLEVLIQATGKADPWQLKRFVDGCARTPAELKEPEFRKGFHAECVNKAYNKPKGRVEEHDFQQALAHWSEKVPRQDPKTRSNIEAGVNGILSAYNTGEVWDLLATETTFTPELLEKRKYLLVNMPIVAGDATTTFVNAMVKLAIQRYVLARQATDKSPILGVICDEFPKVANSYDAAFLAECRSHKGFMVALAQSLPSMVEAMGGEKDKVNALMANFYLKTFHLLGDPETAKFASDLLSEHLVVHTGGTLPPTQGPVKDLTGKGGVTANFNTRFEKILPETRLLGGLRTGGKINKYQVDAILIREGSYRYVTFDQR